MRNFKNVMGVLVLFIAISAFLGGRLQAEPYYDWVAEYTGTESHTLAAWNFNQDELGVSSTTSVPYAIDISGNGKTMYYYGAKTEVIAGGRFDYAFHMQSAAASTDYGQATGTNGFHGSDASVSVEMWVKLNNLGGTQYLLDKKYADTMFSGYQLYITQNGALNRLWWNIGDGSQTIKTIIDVTWETGRYYHLAATWDAATDTAKIFRDGMELVAKTVAGSALVDSNYNIRLGQRIGGTYFPLNDGMIDGVRISEVAYEFAVPPVPPVSGRYYGWTEEEQVDGSTIGLWHFNESSGNAYSAVPGGLPLYAQGGVSHAVESGKFGNGAWCPGGTSSADYWQIANFIDPLWGVDMDATGPDPNLSVAVWINPSVLPDANSPRQIIVDKAASHDPAEGYQLYLWFDEGEVYLKAAIGTTAGTPVKTTVIPDLAVGQWTHVAMVWNGLDHTLRIYQDGRLLGSTVSAGSVYQPSDGLNGSTAYLLRVGNRLTAVFGAFHGVIDDLKISNTALEYVPAPHTGPYYGWLNDYDGSDVGTLALWNFNVPYVDELGTGQSVQEVITGDARKLFAFGGASIVADGKFGLALALPGGQDGADYTQVAGGGVDVFPAGDDPSVSVECWLKLNDVATQDIQYIFDKQYTDSDGFKMYLARDQIADPGITSPDYRLHFVVGDGNEVVDVSAVLTWETGQWYHVAGVWDAQSDTARLFRNGGEVASVYQAGMQIANSAQNLRIGQRLGANFWTFDGVIDNARISDHAYEFAFDCGLAGVQPTGDISGPEGRADCYVDIYDIAALAAQWLDDVPAGSFFEPAEDLAAGYASDKLYPDGTIFPFTIYSVMAPDIYNLKNDGFTAIGPYYNADQSGPLTDAANLGLKYFYRVGLNLDPANFVLPSDSEIQNTITAQVNAVQTNDTIAVWYLTPEELVSTQAEQMHYLEVAADAVRAADPQGRPVWMYETNNRTDTNLGVTVAYQDLCGKGMYTNFTNNQNSRIYCRWTIEQETAAIAASNPAAVPLAVPEMFQDPAAQDAPWIPIWTRHDVYAALVSGAKGVVVFSGFRRPELINYFDEYYQGYASAARELNGSLNLGQVFLFGQRRSDISVTITAGPTTASMTLPENYTAPSVNFADIADVSGTRYLFVVNSANSEVSVNVSGLPSQTIYREELFAATGYAPLTGGSFSLTLEPLTVQAYRFVPSSADISGPAGAPDGRVNLGDFARIAQSWLECTNYADLQCQ